MSSYILYLVPAQNSEPQRSLLPKFPHLILQQTPSTHERSMLSQLQMSLCNYILEFNFLLFFCIYLFVHLLRKQYTKKIWQRYVKILSEFDPGQLSQWKGYTSPRMRTTTYTAAAQ